MPLRKKAFQNIGGPLVLVSKGNIRNTSYNTEYIQNTHYIGKIQEEYTKLTENYCIYCGKTKAKGCFELSYRISQY